MPREYATHDREDYGREEEDRASLRAYRAANLRHWAPTGRHLSELAEWVCSDRWVDAGPFHGHHNQPPVSGEINHASP